MGRTALMEDFETWINRPDRLEHCTVSAVTRVAHTHPIPNRLRPRTRPPLTMISMTPGIRDHSPPGRAGFPEKSGWTNPTPITMTLNPNISRNDQRIHAPTGGKIRYISDFICVFSLIACERADTRVTYCGVKLVRATPTPVRR